MPRALAIETSGQIGSVALIDEQNIVTERQFPHGLKHAAEVVPMLDRLCREQGWQPRDVEHLYVSTGPGSFTGLRIGITLVKTMALATGVKIVAVPTLGVLAENAPADAQHLIIVLDAKREQIFTARFERVKDDWFEREPARLDSLAAMLQRSPRPVYLLGEGLPYHQQFVPLEPDVMVTTAEHWRARATAVAKLGIARTLAGEFADPFMLHPIYIRKPEAQEKYELAHGVPTDVEPK